MPAKNIARRLREKRRRKRRLLEGGEWAVRYKRKKSASKLRRYYERKHGMSREQWKALRAEKKAEKKRLLDEARCAAEILKRAEISARRAEKERVRLEALAERLRAKEKRRAERAWYLEERRKYKHMRKRRHRFNTEGKPSKGFFRKLFDRQSGRCVICGAKLEKAKCHLDHIMPMSLGGKNEDSNFQILCAPCNMAKGAKHPVEFMRQRGYLI